MEKTLKRYFIIFTVPTVIAFSFAFIIPFFQGIYLSFCEFSTVDNAKFVGFSNYIKAFEKIRDLDIPLDLPHCLPLCV